MTERLHLSPKHRAVIEALLREHLPGVEVWAYGSRVNGRSHDGSDLDLVLRGPGLQEIPVGQVADFEEAVRESSIPFLVEARDWAWLPERFHREIERGYVELVRGEQRSSGVRTEWRDLPFSDAVVITPSVGLERGKSYPFVDMASIDVGCRSIYASQYREFQGGGTRFQTGDTLMARITPCLENGKIARYCTLDATEVAHGSTEFIVIRGRPGVTDTEYAYYLTRWEEVRNYAVGQMIGTSGRQRVPAASLDHLIVTIPPLPEQRGIARILGTLDDKIELNRRMNETLEAMARALFKSWFVDFDPVRAKAALRHHTAQQAPGSITPPLRGSRGDKGASPQASRWGESGAAPPPRPWPDVRRQYTAKTLYHAQAMRQSQTNAEGLLWHYLRNEQLGGYKFRRQQPIGPYVADFACLPEKLLIELDGGQHADPNAPDEQRDQFLRQQGYRVLRFWNHDVFADCFGVLESIYAALTHHPPLEGGSKDASLSGRGSPPPLQPAPDGLASTTPPQGGSDWSVARARAYLDRMDPEIVALFPDRFVDSELGEIPAGWEVSEIGKEVDTLGGATPSTKESAFWDKGKQYWATPKDLAKLSSPVLLGTERKITDAGVKKISSGLLPIGAVLLSSRAPIGYLAIAEMPTAVNQGFIAMVCKKRLPNIYVLFWCSENLDYIRGISGGSTFAEISKKAFRPIPVTVPSEQVLAAYEDVVGPLYGRIVANTKELKSLVQIRDLLLPKLISGSIRPFESKEITEAAT